MTKVINIGGRLHSTEQGNVLSGANEILDDVKGKKQDVINSETDAELLRLENEKQNILTFDNIPIEGSNNPVKSDGVYAADKALSDAIEAILILIPSAATALNKLADKAFVNSSVSTATATFRGTYNVVTDLELAYDATHEQIAAKLGQIIATADNNDYAYVQIPVSATSTDIEHTERYKFNGTAWAYEYDLNTSGFTAAQWEAINSAITTALVQKLAALPTAAELAIALFGKQDNLTFDNAPTIGSNNPVKSSGIKSAINDEKAARENADGLINQNIQSILNLIPTGATSSNKLVDVAGMEAAISVISAVIGDLDATFNIVSTDGHITLNVTQENGLITAVEVQSSDIASAADITLLTNRMTTAEGEINTLTENVSSLNGRVGINERNIAYLQQLYDSLQQSQPEPVTTLPSSGQQQGVIYRLAGTTSYSDYMWNGSDWVLMATYNNAVDPRPKKASQNLVTSGGVFDNMGALDVSELNATENPHTLATYADLSAALAAIPSDDYKKGGMSIKFVHSSDNKYIQARCMAQNFTTDVTQWQGVDDEPTVESHNLVESGGVVKGIANLGICSVVNINDYVNEIYVKNQSESISRLELAIASLVTTGTHTGEYLNLLRYRCDNDTIVIPFIGPTYYESEQAALNGWKSSTQNLIFNYHDEGDYYIALSGREPLPVHQVYTSDIYINYHELEALPNITNYLQTQVLNGITNQISNVIPANINSAVNNSGEQLTKNILINRYVKEIQCSTPRATKYCKLILRLGYLNSSKYYNLLRVESYNESDSRIGAADIFNSNYNTFEDAVASIPQNTVISNRSPVSALLSEISITESVNITETIIHPLSFDYAPILSNLNQKQLINGCEIGNIYTKSVVVESNNTSVYNVNLIGGRKYKVNVVFDSALPNNATIYVRYAPAGTTITVKSQSVLQGATASEFEFVAPATYDNYYLVFAEGSDVRVNYSVVIYDYVNLQEHENRLNDFENKKLKVLLVGSSFGVNTISMFPVLAREAGIDITCGSLYYGSASIGLVKVRPLAHQPSKFALNTDYGWYKKFVNGEWQSSTGEVAYRTYQHALQDEKWDIIIFQRGAEELKPIKPGSGTYPYTDYVLHWSEMQTSCLQQMIEYTRTHCDYEPVILFADGLANPVGHTENYGTQTRDTQKFQTLKIAESAQEMKDKFGLNIIPVGVALQNARCTLLSQFGYHGGDTVNPGDMASDGQHLDAGIGYYVTGAALFEYIIKPKFGISILNVDYLPVIGDVQNCWVKSGSVPTDGDMFHGISADNINIAKYAALAAIENPLQISDDIGQRYSAMYNVTQSLTRCTSCFQNTKCETTFFALITPDDGNVLGTPVITMGGTDITNTVYSTTEYNSVVFGIVDIPNVTGDIVINLQAN